MLPWHSGRLPVPAWTFIVFDLPFELDSVGTIPPTLVKSNRVSVAGERLDGDDVDAAVLERRLGGVEEARPHALVASVGHDVQVADDAAGAVLRQRATLHVESDEPHDPSVRSGYREAAVGSVSGQRLPDGVTARRRAEVRAVSPPVRRERHPEVGDGVGLGGRRRFDRDHAER